MNDIQNRSSGSLWRKSRTWRNEAPSFDLSVKRQLLFTGPFLVVEDDALVRKYVITQIESLGYTTFEAANAAEALNVIDTAATVDLLFTDVIVPGIMNGRQLVDVARQRRPSLKVLYTSGYTENAIVHHGRLDTGVLLLAKPYRKSELASMLRMALGS